MVFKRLSDIPSKFCGQAKGEHFEGGRGGVFTFEELGCEMGVLWKDLTSYGIE